MSSLLPISFAFLHRSLAAILRPFLCLKDPKTVVAAVYLMRDQNNKITTCEKETSLLACLLACSCGTALVNKINDARRNTVSTSYLSIASNTPSVAIIMNDSIHPQLSTSPM